MAAQLQFHLGVVPPSDTRLLAPTTAALIIQRCYRRHRHQAALQAAATRLKGWFRSAIRRVCAAAHRRPASTNLFHSFHQRLDLLPNFDQVLANFDQVLAQARADAAAWELERAKMEA